MNYLIQFYWRGPNGEETTESREVSTNLDPNSEEFSEFIAKKSYDMGCGDMMEGMGIDDFRRYPPSIEVRLVESPSFVPKDVIKKWIEIGE